MDGITWQAVAGRVSIAAAPTAKREAVLAGSTLINCNNRPGRKKYKNEGRQCATWSLWLRVRVLCDPMLHLAAVLLCLGDCVEDNDERGWMDTLSEV